MHYSVIDLKQCFKKVTVRLFILFWPLVSVTCYGMTDNSLEDYSPFSYLLPGEMKEHIFSYIIPTCEDAQKYPARSLIQYKKALTWRRVNKEWDLIIKNRWVIHQKDYLQRTLKALCYLHGNSRHYGIKIMTQFRLMPLIKDTIETNGFNSSYLHYATKYNVTLVVKYLLENYRKQIIGSMHLFTAASHNAFEPMKLLLEHGTNPNTYLVPPGITPLHIAAKKDFYAIALLLIQYGAKVNAKTRDKATPLHFAVVNKSYNVTKLLLENKADQSKKTNIFAEVQGNNLGFEVILYRSKQTALEIAQVNKDKKMIALLKSYKKKRCIIQ